MDWWQIVVAALVIGAGAIVLTRSRRLLQRAIVGHDVTRHVETDVSRMEIDGGVEAPWLFCIRGSVPTSPPPVMDGNAAWWRWAHTQGGHDVRSTVLQVTLQAQGDGPISIEPPIMDSHKADPTSPEDVVYGPGGVGGNGIHSRRYRFTLDGESSSREYLGGPNEQPASFTIDKGETSRLLIVVMARDGKRHQWTLEIPLLHAGRRHSLQIRDDDRPFVTYGGHGLPLRMWGGDGWMDSPVPL